MTEVQQEYLQWMGNPQREGSKVQWAKDHAVSVATLYKWEKAEWYQSGLEQTMREMHLSMDKTLEVIAAVQKQAARGASSTTRIISRGVSEWTDMSQTHGSRRCPRRWSYMGA